MTMLCEKHVKEGDSNTKADAIALCHHCGRPVCSLTRLYSSARASSIQVTKDHCGYEIDDNEFALWPEARLDILPNAEILGKHDGELPLAVHCRDCLRAYHSNYFSTLKG